jgi:hypothetical protein
LAEHGHPSALDDLDTDDCAQQRCLPRPAGTEQSGDPTRRYDQRDAWKDELPAAADTQIPNFDCGLVSILR